VKCCVKRKKVDGDVYLWQEGRLRLQLVLIAGDEILLVTALNSGPKDFKVLEQTCRIGCAKLSQVLVLYSHV
jgi:hypothetical protein